MDKYNCLVTTNSMEIDEGIWRIKTSTKKTLIVEKLSEHQIYDYYEKGDIIKCSRLKQNGNTLNEWSDGSFTIYPNQNGIPFYFSKCG